MNIINQLLEATEGEIYDGAPVDKETVIQYLDEYPSGDIDGFKKWLADGMRY